MKGDGFSEELDRRGLEQAALYGLDVLEVRQRD